jgi:hypothetical protein
MHPYRVLVIGGTGFFGRRLVQRLARQGGLAVTVAGRSVASAQSLVDGLRPTAQADLSAAELDTGAPAWAERLRALAPQVVVNTAGPFQGQDYAVARACIAAGAHHLDLADGRAFVAGIGGLDAEASAAGLMVTSGASSVPALSSAVVDHLVHGWQQVDRIDIGISPGNRTDRGLATMQAILGYCGQRLPGGGLAVYGWQGSTAHTYPAPVGRRLLSPCDVPDLVLLPPRYPGRPQLRFGAGLELRALHRGMNAMALATRLGLVRDWSVHAGWLKRMADALKGLGTDAGAMHVTVTGRQPRGGTQTRTWHLVATHGDGPFVPTLAAAALVRKLQHGELPFIGARPCVGCLTLDDFAREAEGLHITMAEAGS